MAKLWFKLRKNENNIDISFDLIYVAKIAWKYLDLLLIKFF